jgi:hypothetical protein
LAPFPIQPARREVGQYSVLPPGAQRAKPQNWLRSINPPQAHRVPNASVARSMQPRTTGASCRALRRRPARVFASALLERWFRSRHSVRLPVAAGWSWARIDLAGGAYGVSCK